MKNCPQGNSNVWQHGKDCVTALESILAGQTLPRLEKVTWLQEAISYFRNLSTVEQRDILTYLLYHDIGKTYSHENHSEHSARIWRSLDPREHIAQYMASDMVMHSGTQEEAFTLKHHSILRLTALAECYANMEMFGGQDSTSFKIKLKKIIRNGNRIKSSN